MTIYSAFLSHSHAGDEGVVADCQRRLERIAKPWYRRRALRLFRAKGSMPYESKVWPPLERALQASEHFILFASPHSRRSDWVRHEIQWWLRHRGVQSLVILQTGGEIVWDPARGSFDAQATTALDADLFASTFDAAPWILDVRHMASGLPRSAADERRLHTELVQVAARLHGRPVDDLEGDDLRQQRLTRITGLGTALLTLGIGLAGWSAYQRSLAESARVRAAAIVGLTAAATDRVGAGGVDAQALSLLGSALALAGADGGPESEARQLALQWWAARLVPFQELLQHLEAGELFDWAGKTYLVGHERVAVGADRKLTHLPR